MDPGWTRDFRYPNHFGWRTIEDSPQQPGETAARYADLLHRPLGPNPVRQGVRVFSPRSRRKEMAWHET